MFCPDYAELHSFSQPWRDRFDSLKLPLNRPFEFSFRLDSPFACVHCVPHPSHGRGLGSSLEGRCVARRDLGCYGVGAGRNGAVYQTHCG